MLDKLRQYIAEKRLLDPSDRLLVGLSGGPDSVALLQAMLDLGYDCLAVHVNFHLRGEESQRDEAFVRRWCSERGVRLRVEDLPAEAEARQRGISLEMAARDLRYARFEEIRQAEHCRWIVVGHHRDDNLETFFLNFLRGSGLKGLCGMKPCQGRVVRPLLGLSRADIEAWLEKRGIPYILDSSNQDTAFRRNQLRHEVLPVLDRMDPAARERMAFSLSLLGETQAAVEAMLPAVTERLGWSRLEEDAQGICRLSQAALDAEPLAFQALYEVLSGYGFDAKTVRTAWQQRREQPGKQYVSATHRLLLDRGQWLLCRRTEAGRDRDAEEVYWIGEDLQTASLPFAMSARCEDVEPGQAEGRIDRRPICACLDADRLNFPLCLRRARREDAFVPFGMKGRKLLSDFLTDLKVSRMEKERTWVLLSGQEIAWVLGYRVSQAFALGPESRRMVKFELA